jgi:hypothetical protein
MVMLMDEKLSVTRCFDEETIECSTPPTIPYGSRKDGKGSYQS